ncbi:MAG: hypothetical protein U1E46_08170 [Hyphomicrobiales bacterium]
MADVLLRGRAASLDQAIGEAARLLSDARFPLIAGLAADAAAIRAAVRLARRLNAAVDHAAGPVLSRIGSVMAGGGTLVATPAEVRTRAETLLIVGPLGGSSLFGYVSAGAARNAVAIGAPEETKALKGRKLAVAPLAAGDRTALAATLASLRATVSQKLPNPSRELAAAADVLRNATFGAALYDPAALDEPALAMLMALVNDLNAEHRFTSLAMPVAGNGMGALMAGGWLADAPLPFAFRADGEAVSDPWRFDAARLAHSGECDAALWLDTLGGSAPRWLAAVPGIAISNSVVPGAAVSIAAGAPGVDHDAILYRAEAATLSAYAATAPSDAPDAASIIDAIAAALPSRVAKKETRR